MAALTLLGAKRHGFGGGVVAAPRKAGPPLPPAALLRCPTGVLAAAAGSPPGLAALPLKGARSFGRTALAARESGIG